LFSQTKEGLTIIEPRDLYFGPGADEYLKMEQSMRIFAGRVLKMTKL
jgi:hypothetical protein